MGFMPSSGPSRPKALACGAGEGPSRIWAEDEHQGRCRERNGGRWLMSRRGGGQRLYAGRASEWVSLADGAW